MIWSKCYVNYIFRASACFILQIRNCHNLCGKVLLTRNNLHFQPLLILNLISGEDAGGMLASLIDLFIVYVGIERLQDYIGALQQPPISPSQHTNSTLTRKYIPLAKFYYRRVFCCKRSVASLLHIFVSRHFENKRFFNNLQ